MCGHRLKCALEADLGGRPVLRLQAAKPQRGPRTAVVGVGLQRLFQQVGRAECVAIRECQRSARYQRFGLPRAQRQRAVGQAAGILEASQVERQQAGNAAGSRLQEPLRPLALGPLPGRVEVVEPVRGPKPEDLERFAHVRLQRFVAVDPRRQQHT